MSNQPNLPESGNSILKNFPPVTKSSFWKRLMQRFRMLRRFLGYYRLQKMLSGFYVAQTIYATTKLGLADHLNDSAKSCEMLASEMDVDVNSLIYLMRLLSKLGIVSVAKNGNYKLTALGSYLRANNPNSIRGTILSLSDMAAPAWGNLSYSIKTGKAAFDNTFQMSFYEYLDQNAEANTHFNQWMEETTREWIIPTLDMCDLSKVKTVVDVGGNTGMLSAMILNEYPNLQSILFDQEYVVSDAEKLLESAGVADRCQVIGGDFFESVPAGGDLYIISRVLLNWDDAHALKILKSCRAAMESLGNLLIIDFVLPNKGGNTFSLLGSLNSLVLSGRIMRTEDEYYELLDKAGFQSPRLIKTGGMLSFIEAVPRYKS
ncbi:MAG: methyltransferase [Candidatus Parabeggiatoa sp.]|nr:methyltransferase [Candidatus Parabeggiatoa sp.]